MAACGSSKEEAGLQELDPMQSAVLLENLAPLNEQIATLTEEDIKNLLESGDPFAGSAATSWETAQKDLTTYVSCDEGKIEIGDNDEYIVSFVCKFENREADFVYTLNKEAMPTALSINPRYTMGDKMAQAGQNTILGVGIVFLMLFFLSFIISLMKYIPKLVEAFDKKKKEEPAAPAAAPKAAPAVVEPVEEELVDDGELVAVIAAAIAASENTSTDSFRVRSIRKSTKGNWRRA